VASGGKRQKEKEKRREPNAETQRAQRLRGAIDN